MVQTVQCAKRGSLSGSTREEGRACRGIGYLVGFSGVVDEGFVEDSVKGIG